ncbi:nitrous oxide reductase accessory protein NosL [bacterium]|nr:nitrous oxide reductase accessory protein NosL [bacterium]
MTDRSLEPDMQDEELYYEEAPRSSLAEGIGVAVALLALFVIGYAGYVWLTPGVEFADLLHRSPGISTDDTQMAAAEQPDEQTRCPQCSMYAMRSIAAVHADFTDGSSGYFDGWGCVADWAREHATGLSSAEVRDIASADREPQWLTADTASYRFGTARLDGSMAPFVAAYATPGHAADDGERGGEVMDFSALLRELGLAAGSESVETVNTNGSATDGNQAGQQSDTDADQLATEPDSLDEEPEEPAVSVPGNHADNLFSHSGFTDSSCPYCGMFADRSLTHVVVRWSDGSYTQHDSFDCVFNLMADEDRSIDAIEVTAYDIDKPGSRWLDATAAWFLYDTETVKGSMPPYVAAFANATDAENAQPALGGQLLDFNGLAAMWQQ